jgi:hypothetical protein
MWVFTPRSAVSIVEMPGSEGNLLQIRSRRSGHLESLGFGTDQIQRTPSRDYMYRVIASHDTAMRKIMSAIRQVDYPNFKDACAAAGTLPPEMLTDIWMTVYDNLDERHALALKEASKEAAERHRLATSDSQGDQP